MSRISSFASAHGVRVTGELRGRYRTSLFEARRSFGGHSRGRRIRFRPSRCRTSTRSKSRGLPEGYYVKAINFAGHPVDDWKIDLTSGAGGLLFIEVSPDAGEISGVVRNAKATRPRRDRPGLARRRRYGALREIGCRAANSASDSLPPGDYRVAAFQDLDDDLAQYPPFRASSRRRRRK